MNRKPIYHPHSTQFRVCSMPNGLWVAQVRVGNKKGMNATVQLPHGDPWQSLHPPTSMACALDYMYMKKPIKQSA